MDVGYFIYISGDRGTHRGGGCNDKTFEINTEEKS